MACTAERHHRDLQLNVERLEAGALPITTRRPVQLKNVLSLLARDKGQVAIMTLITILHHPSVDGLPLSKLSAVPSKTL